MVLFEHHGHGSISETQLNIPVVPALLIQVVWFGISGMVWFARYHRVWFGVSGIIRYGLVYLVWFGVSGMVWTVSCDQQGKSAHYVPCDLPLIRYHMA